MRTVQNASSSASESKVSAASWRGDVEVTPGWSVPAALAALPSVRLARLTMHDHPRPCVAPAAFCLDAATLHGTSHVTPDGALETPLRPRCELCVAAGMRCMLRATRVAIPRTTLGGNASVNRCLARAIRTLHVRQDPSRTGRAGAVTHAPRRDWAVRCVRPSLTRRPMRKPLLTARRRAGTCDQPRRLSAQVCHLAHGGQRTRS